MNWIEKKADKASFYVINHALLILPAVALGILAMISGGVSPSLWGQQAVAWAVLALLSFPLRRAVGRIPAEAWSICFLTFLAATLFGEEAGGAKRWIDLVVFHVNAANLVLPVLLAVLCCVKYPSVMLIGAAVVLSLQPDASQLIAFSAATLPILWRHEKKRLCALGSTLVLFLLLVRCIRVPITIEPVPYCEGILDMLLDLSWVLHAAGWISLAAIPAWFMYRFFRHGGIYLLSIATYYAVTMLFVFTGEYPVPFMGFGLSPIARYWLVYICSASFDT